MDGVVLPLFSPFHPASNLDYFELYKTGAGIYLGLTVLILFPLSLKQSQVGPGLLLKKHVQDVSLLI